MIDKLSIFRPRNCVNLETIFVSIKWPNLLANQLGSTNNQLLLLKLKSLGRESLPIIKILS